MSRGSITREYVAAVADGIRYANGTENTYTPAQMGNAVRALKKTLVAKTVNANGEYNPASDSADGYSALTVAVPNSYVAADEGKVVQNGALVAQTSRTVNQNGTYNTTTNSEMIVNVSGGGGGGNTLTGTTPPGTALGADGDFYVQTSSDGVLASDGACYINTGIIPNALYAVEIVAAITQQTANYDTLFGTRNGSAGRFTARFGSNINGTLDVHKSISPTSNYVTWSTGQTKSTMLDTYIRLYLKDMLRVNGVFQNGATISSVDAFPYSLFLFANNNAGSVSDYAYCAIKRFKVWNSNDELIMYLVPSSYNGEACMYDLVTGQYFHNSGTGTFTYTDLGASFDAILWKKVSGAWTVVSEWG